MKKLFLLAVIGLFCSCERALFDKDLASTNPRANFEYLWTECNEKFSFFDVKQVDWDQVFTTYSDRISDDMTNPELFAVLSDMLNELRDGHTNLVSDFDISIFNVQRLGQDNFDWRIVTDNYLPEDYFLTGPFQHEFLNGTNREIGYVRFPEFPGTVDDDNLNFVLNRYADTKGLILDLRENGGGAVTDVFALLSRFVDVETEVFTSRIKNGTGRNEFTAPEPAKVSPSSQTRYTKPIMMLVDRGTYSAGSFTSLATKAIPNITLVGDTTGGGLGLPNGGQLPNGWTYRFSITQTLDMQGNPEYENGVPPDIHALIDFSDRSADEVIERAIQELQ